MSAREWLEANELRRIKDVALPDRFDGGRSNEVLLLRPGLQEVNIGSDALACFT